MTDKLPVLSDVRIELSTIHTPLSHSISFLHDRVSPSIFGKGGHTDIVLAKRLCKPNRNGRRCLYFQQ